MNNSQFRKLVLDTPSSSHSHQIDNPRTAPSAKPSATPMLGSRARSSIPMTPRSVAGYSASNDFARQLAEHRREITGEPPRKKFRSMAAPKGTKLARGYQDRTLHRQPEPSEQDEKAKRIQALEEMVKLQQIDQAMFEQLRSEIGVGGDVASTHLVKGLDRALLERVRNGEDVSRAKEQEEIEEDLREDVDEELENVAVRDVEAVERVERVKKGEMAPPPSAGGEEPKSSRDEILKRLKASRAAAVPDAKSTAPTEPSLGAKFKKVGSGSLSNKKRFVESVNGRQREVLVTTDKDGNTKRKVRWLEKEVPTPGPPPPEPVLKPIGMEVPAELAAKQRALLEQQQKAEEEDDDIFDDVGTDYNPLADIGSDSADGQDVLESGKKLESDTSPPSRTHADTEAAVKRSQNYFATQVTADDTEDKRTPLTQDPTLLAALKRTAALRKTQEDRDGGNSDSIDTNDADYPEKTLRRKHFLEKLNQLDRKDAEDMYLGFGESRFGDEEDEDGPIWEDDEGGKKAGRKRGPKKRKGNKDNVGDVMGVLAGRKDRDK